MNITLFTYLGMVGDTEHHSRRGVLKGGAGTVAGTTMLSMAGCVDSLGGGGGDVSVAGLYDLSGATSDVGEPTSTAVRDAIKYINDENLIDRHIVHDWVDYAYEVAQAQQAYDNFTSGTNPAAIIGWETGATEALASKVARDKIVYISASCSANLLSEDTPFNFFPNLDYTSQARTHLKWIKNNDSKAKIAFIFSNTPLGNSPIEGGKKYAETLGLEVGEDINLPLTANSARSQLKKAKDNDVDYLIHQNMSAPMHVLLKDQKDVYPHVTVCGLTWTVDEIRVEQSPDIFEGARYVTAFKTFQEALEVGGKGADAIQASFEANDRSQDNVDIANLHYPRGFIHGLVLMRAIQNADNPPNTTVGEDIRNGMFEIDDWDVWGLSEPINFKESDRRATMTGRLYEVTDGTLEFDTSIELPRKEEWIGL